MTHKPSNGQLSLPLDNFLVRRKISTREIFNELTLKSPKGSSFLRSTSELTDLARKKLEYRQQVSEGVWTATVVDRTDTKRYLWNLYFQPMSRSLT
jgi:hypothetical protein